VFAAGAGRLPRFVRLVATFAPGTDALASAVQCTVATCVFGSDPGAQLKAAMEAAALSADAVAMASRELDSIEAEWRGAAEGAAAAGVAVGASPTAAATLTLRSSGGGTPAIERDCRGAVDEAEAEDSGGGEDGRRCAGGGEEEEGIQRGASGRSQRPDGAEAEGAPSKAGGRGEAEAEAEAEAEGRRAEQAKESRSG